MGGHSLLNGKIVIGLTEKVTIYGNPRKKIVIAKTDIGATKNSIYTNLAAEFILAPKIK